jgi:hypothetical protein
MIDHDVERGKGGSEPAFGQFGGAAASDSVRGSGLYRIFC